MTCSKKSTKELIHSKWASYVTTRDQNTRNFLIENYLPLLNSIAKRIHGRLRGNVELDDLISSGVLGLMAAVDSYDPSRGIAFETFCTYRIHGAIFDEVPRNGLGAAARSPAGPATGRGRAGIVENAGYNPTDQELADHLSVSQQTLQNMRRDDRKAMLVSLTTITSGHGDDVMIEGELDALSDDGTQDVSQRVMRQEFDELTTAGLNKTERLVLKLYYFEEMTMSQVGKALDLSESRVSQMHSTILVRLRANFAGKSEKRSTRSFANSPRIAGRITPTTPRRTRMAA